MQLNWKELKEKASPYLEKLNPLLDKAHELGEKAMDFTGKQLQNTPIVLKSQEEFDTLKWVKRFLIIASEDETPEAQEITLRSPIWSTLAWKEVATLRFLSITATPELARSLDLVGPASMKVYWQGELKQSLSDLASIKKWWSDRNYDGSLPSTPAFPSPDTKPIENPTEAPTKAPIDPLA